MTGLEGIRLSRLKAKTSVKQGGCCKLKINNTYFESSSVSYELQKLFIKWFKTGNLNLICSLRQNLLDCWFSWFQRLLKVLIFSGLVSCFHLTIWLANWDGVFRSSESLNDLICPKCSLVIVEILLPNWHIDSWLLERWDPVLVPNHCQKWGLCLRGIRIRFKDLKL